MPFKTAIFIHFLKLNASQAARTADYLLFMQIPLSSPNKQSREAYQVLD